MEAGTVLAGRFRIERLRGRGGMASVYEATQLDLNRRVALKLLTDEQDAIPSIEREARAAAQLAHPHIVQVTEVVKSDDGPPFLVMELLDGESLDERIGRKGPLAADRAAFIAVQILSALGSAHASGIIHRDVKPANVFLTRTAATNDFVKLLDFGIARRASGVISSKSEGRGGTPAYMAPEQIGADAPLDERTDVWGVGVCLYEMIAGTAPFEAQNIPSLLVKICEASAPPLATDRELAAIVTKAMAKDPKDRYASAEEMRLALLPIARADAVPSAHAPILPSLAADRHDAPTLTAPMPPIREPESSRETKPSGATLASSAPSHGPQSSPRGFAIGFLGAGVVLAIAIGLSRRPLQEAPAPKASASASAAPKLPLGQCVIAPPLPPWSIARGRLSLSATNDAVLVATDSRDEHHLPRYASATTDGSTLEEWPTPEFIAASPHARWHSDATISGDGAEVAAVAIRVDRPPGKTPQTKYVLFVNNRDSHGAATFARVFVEGEETSFARASTLGHATVVVASGIGVVNETIKRPFPHTRVVRRDRSFVDTALFPDVEPPADLALATTQDRIAVAATFDDRVQVATYEAANLRAQPPIRATGKPSTAQIAIFRGDTLAVWMDLDAQELRYMVVRGGDLMHDGMLARGEIVAHAVAATPDGVLLAFAKKVGNETTLFAGSGADLREAALAVKPLRIVHEHPVTQLRMAGGSRPWLAWTEATGEEAADAHVARLHCP